MSRILASTALIVVLSTAPAWAQTEPNTPVSPPSATVDDRIDDAIDADDDDGFDMGWLGLLGLLGLAGLTGRNRTHVRDTTTMHRP